ncbi:hypothetical protein VNO80_07426 [Phaseolus coccineus]|uniref:Pentatricopeptide repeat-containing protein n=1 Tax=Phaseolus coccineus TaxID=3886 RepID=A0AAN9NQL1_PHACN
MSGTQVLVRSLLQLCTQPWRPFSAGPNSFPSPSLSLHKSQNAPSKHNIATIVHSLCDSRRFSEAHHRFSLSFASGSLPDERACNVLLARMLGSRTPHATWRLIQSLIASKPGFVPSLVNYNRLMDQFCGAHPPLDAHRLFFDMKSRGHCPNVVSFTTLINGYGLVRGIRDARKRDVEGGRELMCRLWEMMSVNAEDSVKTAAFANLVDFLCREGFFGEVFRIAEELPFGSGFSEKVAFGQMVDSLCRVGRHKGAARIVYVMRKRGFVPSEVSYNYVIHGLSRDGDCMRAYQLLEEGAEFGFMLSEHTYKVLVEALCEVLDVDKAKKVLKLMLSKEELLNVLVFMLENQCHADVITLNTVINGFCKMGSVDEASKVLHDMLLGKFAAPDVVTFTTLIYGMLDAARINEALDLFHKLMPENGIKPSVVTYNALLRGLFKLKRPNDALMVLDDMVNDGITADITTYTVVVESLCESDQVEEAKRFWHNVIWPSGVHDNFVYAAILKGFCRSGNFNEACHFLYELVDSGVPPNIFSYNNILINCACNLGLKSEAYQIVREMKRNGLTPDSVTWRILDKLNGKGGKDIHSEDPTMSTFYEPRHEVWIEVNEIRFVL